MIAYFVFLLLLCYYAYQQDCSTEHPISEIQQRFTLQGHSRSSTFVPSESLCMTFH